MGDLSTEPSMEEILSSIKRIIAEEGDQPARRARPARAISATPLSSIVDDDEVLELSDMIPAAPQPEPEPMPMSGPIPDARRLVEPPRAAEPPRAESPKAPEPIVSTEAMAASRGSFDSLSRLLVRPEPDSEGTLEGLVRDMLRPMLREWLDANLPAMVETLVSREIARIAGQAR